MDTTVMIFGTPDQMHAARSLIQAFVLSEPPAPWYFKSLKVMHPLLIFDPSGRSYARVMLFAWTMKLVTSHVFEFIKFCDSVFRVPYAWNVNYAEQRLKFQWWNFSRLFENVLDFPLWDVQSIMGSCQNLSQSVAWSWKVFKPFCMRTHHLKLWVHWHLWTSTLICIKYWQCFIV
jgi:hypothetical protein